MGPCPCVVRAVWRAVLGFPSRVFSVRYITGLFMAAASAAPGSPWTPGCRASGVHHGSMVSLDPVPTRAWPLAAGETSTLPVAMTVPLGQQPSVAAGPFSSPACALPQSAVASRSIYPPGHTSRFPSSFIGQPNLTTCERLTGSCSYSAGFLCGGASGRWQTHLFRFEASLVAKPS